MNKPSSLWVRCVASLCAGLLMAGSAWSAGPTSAFTVTGGVTSPATYDLAGLSALPAITQTVSYTSGSSTQVHTYVGASLWSVLDARGIAVNPLIKNDVLNRYVVVTGSDGYKVVFSTGEIKPDFGNRPDLVAYSEIVGGVSTPIGADGFARVTAPGDTRGGRYVSNVFNVDVRNPGSTQAGIGGGLSSSFVVNGAVTSVRSFDLAALQALPTVTSVVGGISYTGVSLWDLLSTSVGIPLDPLVKNDVLGKYVVATGSDGYKVVFSLGEIEPTFGNQPDIIAFAANGVGLGNNGFARLVAPNDVKQGRWVSNLVSLEVFSANPTPVPEPASAVMMALGLVWLAAWAAPRRSGRRPG